MKYKVVLFLTIIIYLTTTLISFSYNAPQTLNISGESAILIDAANGDVLYQKNGTKLMYPASTTKIMTAILTLENTNLKDKVIIDKETPFTEGSRIYVIEGEEFTVEQLLYALLVQSANDAAVALAKHISGSVEEFAELMNKRAKELGAKNTHFTNPNGLPDKNHVTTAYDLAMIAKHAMTLPKFREIVKTVRYQIPPTNKQSETRYLKNSNRLLWGIGYRNKILYNGKWIDIKYDAVNGIKTGYTNEAQQCLVASAERDGKKLISVVLRAIGTNIYTDTRKLLDYGFNNFKQVYLVEAGKTIETIKLPNGDVESLNIIAQNSLSKLIPINIENPKIEHLVELYDNIEAPVKKGEVLGKIHYSINGENIGKVNLVASQTVNEKKIYRSIKKMKSGFSFTKLLFWLFILYIVWRTIVTVKRVKKIKRIRRMKKYKYKDYMITRYNKK